MLAMPRVGILQRPSRFKFCIGEGRLYYEKGMAMLIFAIDR